MQFLMLRSLKNRSSSPSARQETLPLSSDF
nr:MAG TPA: hypothetical protein [Caudoviricetes sp.]